MDPFTPSVKVAVDDTISRFHLPGVSISVVHGSQTYTSYHGHLSLSPSTEVNSKTLFHGASTTKAMLCAAWAQHIYSRQATKPKPKLSWLWSRAQQTSNNLTFSSPLVEIIGEEDFQLSDALRTKQATLEDVLSHRSGLPSHNMSMGRPNLPSPRAHTVNARNLPLMDCGIRERYEYGNIGYIAASYGLEVARKGQPLGDTLRQELWKPLGMKETFAGGKEVKASERAGDLAKSYSWTNGEYLEEFQPTMEEISGCGYVISTVADYARWMSCLLNPPDEGGILSKEMINDLWTPRSMELPSGGRGSDPYWNCPFDGVLAYGLGWSVTSYRGHEVVHHGGALFGAGAFVLLCPAIKWGVTIFGNGGFVQNAVTGIAVELLDIALGIPEGQRYARRRRDEQARKFYKQLGEGTAEKEKQIYPDAPSKPETMLAAPLRAYAGTYVHPGYGELIFYVAEGYDADARTGHLYCSFVAAWERSLTLKHVDGELWVAVATYALSPLKSVHRAQSEKGKGGEIKRLGMALEGSMPDHLIWFERQP